jgi:hypothetical protein
MIAGHHDEADVRFGHSGDGGRRFWSKRIVEDGQSDELEFFLDTD